LNHKIKAQKGKGELLMQTALKVVNNKNTAIELLIRQEEKAVNEAIAAGYKDPREDEREKQFLNFEGPDGTEYRRFIEEFTSAPYSDFNGGSQVREETYDKDYCKNELSKSIKQEGLNYPPFVKMTGKIVHPQSGHNRSYAHNFAYPDEPIPVFKVSSIYKKEEDGSYVQVVGSEKQFFEQHSAAQPNKKVRTSKDTTIKDAARNLRELFNIDPTFQGLNPSGDEIEVGPKEGGGTIFDKIMDWQYPNELLHHVPRGRVYAEFAKPSALARTIGDTEINGDLNDELGWGSQWEKPKKPGKAVKGKRKSILDSKDLDTKDAYVGVTNTNGENFHTVIAKHLVDRLASKQPFNFSKVNLVCEIHKFQNTPEDLKKKREKFIEKITQWNNQMKNLCNRQDLKKRMPLIDKIWFPQQLLGGLDNGQLWVWNQQDNIFQVQ